MKRCAHIDFEAIDCVKLEQRKNYWFCKRLDCKIHDAECCVYCRFEQLKKREEREAITRRKVYG